MHLLSTNGILVRRPMSIMSIIPSILPTYNWEKSNLYKLRDKIINKIKKRILILNWICLVSITLVSIPTVLFLTLSLAVTLPIIQYMGIWLGIIDAEIIILIYMFVRSQFELDIDYIHYKHHGKQY